MGGGNIPQWNYRGIGTRWRRRLHLRWLFLFWLHLFLFDFSHLHYILINNWQLTSSSDSSSEDELDTGGGVGAFRFFGVYRGLTAGGVFFAICFFSLSFFREGLGAFVWILWKNRTNLRHHSANHKKRYSGQTASGQVSAIDAGISGIYTRITQAKSDILNTRGRGEREESEVIGFEVPLSCVTPDNNSRISVLRQIVTIILRQPREASDTHKSRRASVLLTQAIWLRPHFLF